MISIAYKKENFYIELNKIISYGKFLSEFFCNTSGASFSAMLIYVKNMCTTQTKQKKFLWRGFWREYMCVFIKNNCVCEERRLYLGRKMQN